MSLIQWIQAVSVVVAFLVLIITNAVLLTKFFSKMASRFDVLNDRVESLKDQFIVTTDSIREELRRDIDTLGDRLESAAKEIAGNAIDAVKLTGRVLAIEKRIDRLSKGRD